MKTNAPADLISVIEEKDEVHERQPPTHDLTPPNTPPSQRSNPALQDSINSGTTMVASRPSIDPSRQSRLLHSVLQSDNVDQLRSSLTLGVNINDSIDGETLLSRCIQLGHGSLTRFLLDNGAVVHPQDLITAVIADDYRIVRRLLRRSAPINELCTLSNSPVKWSALHFAAYYGHKEITRLLLSHNANFDQLVSDGSTPLHVSSDDTICILLDHGASVFLKDNKGRIPLHIKAREGRLFAVQALIEHGSPINLRDYQGLTPIVAAIINGNNALVTEFIRAGANVHARVSAEALCKRDDREHWRGQLQDLSLLHFAVSTPNCSVSVVRTLLDAGVPVDIRSADGSTPLQWSCLPLNLFHLSEIAANTPSITEESNVPLDEASATVARYLIRRGANVNVQNIRRWTPLHTASLNDNHKLAKLLLENGASTSTKEDWSRTSLRVAIVHNSERIVRLILAHRSRRSIEFESLHAAAFHNADAAAKVLIQHNADINALDDDSKTALHVACERKALRVVELLVHYGANIEALDGEGCTPLLTAAKSNAVDAARVLIEQGAHVLHTDKTGFSALHHAATNNSVDLTNLLLRYGADADHNGGDSGIRPLHAAAWGDSIAVAEVLVSSGADVDAADANRWTPLHDAASKNAIGMVEFLIRAGAGVNRRTRRTGSSVLDIAVDYRASEEVVQCIIRAGGRSAGSRTERRRR
jgi:ankyrin repeat protein